LQKGTPNRQSLRNPAEIKSFIESRKITLFLKYPIFSILSVISIEHCKECNSLGTTSIYNGESKAKQTPYQSSSQNHFKVQVLNTFMKLRKLNYKHIAK